VSCCELKLLLETCGGAWPCVPPNPTVRNKLLMLLAPFLRRWNYTRSLEQVCPVTHRLGEPPFSPWELVEQAVQRGLGSAGCGQRLFTLLAQRCPIVRCAVALVIRWVMNGRIFTSVLRLLGILQIGGGNKYLPPRQDVNAPDLYIPLMAAATYCLLSCFAAALHGKFKPEMMYSSVRLC
jgi:YIF1